MKSRSSTHVFQIDPSRPVPPEALIRPSGDPPEVIALLAEEASRRHGWPARFSAELAKRWATDDIPLLLADADLSGASLHELFDTTNDEGVSDLIAFGASAERVIREVAEGAHQFIPSGTAVANPEPIFRDARWSALLSEIRNSGRVVLLYLPAESAEAAELAASADRVIRLASGPPDASPEGNVTVVHVAHQEEAPTDWTDEEPSDAASTTASGGATSEAVGSTPGAVPKAASTTKKKTSQPNRRSSLALMGALLMLLLVVIVVAVWLGYLEIPGIISSALTSLLGLGHFSDLAGPDPLG